MSNSNPNGFQHTFLEISDRTLKVRVGEDQQVFSLERCAEGRITDECAATLRQQLAPYAGVALCALGGRGVSVRRFEVPHAPDEQLRQILSLKLEQEFPLPPEEFAWGYEVSRGVNGVGRSGEAATTDRESSTLSRAELPVTGPSQATVLALRKEAVQDYDQLFEATGIRASYCLGILNRVQQLGTQQGCVAIVDIGRHCTDALLIDSGQPLQLRTIPWGGEAATQAIATALGLDRESAERKKCASAKETLPPLQEDLSRFAAQLRAFLTAPIPHAPTATASRVYLTGGGAQCPQLVDTLSRELQLPCELLPEPRALTVTPSILLTRDLAVDTETAPPPAVRWIPWSALLGLLLLALLAMRYLPPYLRTPGLQQRIETARERLAALPAVDAELEFLNTVNSQQLDALEALRIVAEAAPAGTRVADLSVSQSGAVTFSGQVSKVGAINQLRQAIADSGWFTGTPIITSQERVKRQWKFRIVGQLVAAKKRPRVDRTPAESEETQTPTGSVPAASTVTSTSTQSSKTTSTDATTDPTATAPAVTPQSATQPTTRPGATPNSSPPVVTPVKSGGRLAPTQ